MNEIVYVKFRTFIYIGMARRVENVNCDDVIAT